MRLLKFLTAVVRFRLGADVRSLSVDKGVVRSRRKDFLLSIDRTWKTRPNNQALHGAVDQRPEAEALVPGLIVSFPGGLVVPQDGEEQNQKRCNDQAGIHNRVSRQRLELPQRWASDRRVAGVRIIFPLVGLSGTIYGRAAVQKHDKAHGAECSENGPHSPLATREDGMCV